MPRAIGTMAGKVTQTTTTFAVCWKLVTQQGLTFGFTTCSRDLVIGGLTYTANSGMEPTAVEAALGLQVDNSEVLGFIRPGIIQADQVRAGLFDGAIVYKFIADYTAPSADIVKLLWGVQGEVQIKGENQFNTELRGSSQWLAADIIPLTQGTCRAIFGDPVQCKATVHNNTAALTSFSDAKTFRASSLIGARADGFFDYGYLVWSSGNNNGLRMDVRHFNQATAEFSLMTDSVLAFTVGDTFTVYEGCAKTRPACKTKTGPSGVNNILNMDAEPDVPGNDVVLRIVRAS